MVLSRNKIRVLVVDDSIVYRSQLRQAIEMLDNAEVVAVLSTGKLALDRLAILQVDLLILDLEMPEMDGLQTLDEIRKRGISVKVIIFSVHSEKGAEKTLEALRLGANDFVLKPGSNEVSRSSGDEPAKIIKELLKPRIDLLFPDNTSKLYPDAGADSVERTVNPRKLADGPNQIVFPQIIWELFRPKVLVIGSSTGGPNALEKLFSQLEPPFRIPILVTQHMPAVFTMALAQRIGKIVGAGKFVTEVREALNDEMLLPNRIYFAPGDFHMSLRKDEDEVRIVLDQTAPENFVRPSVDPLFRSAAQIFRSGALGVILTGMGSDGLSGAESIKNNGGSVIIQDRDSCVVYGMPGSVASAGAFDFQGNLEFIGKLISGKISMGSKPSSKDTVGS